MRDGAGADGTDKASTFLDETLTFAFESDHEASDIVEKDDGDTTLVAQVNELSGLVRLRRVDDRLLVGNYAGQVAMNVSPSGDHHLSECWFERLNPRIVDDA